MTSRKIVAVFESRDAAENARSSLLELGLHQDHISIADQQSGQRTVRSPAAHGSFWAHIKEMFMPDEDRSTIEESIRRGEYVVVATVDDTRADEAIARLERAGAVDLNDREAQWRTGGSTAASVPNDTRNSDVAETQVGSEAARPSIGDGAEDTIPVIEERLRVGKREVNRGSVRVRSYIVEEPVHEEVRLRDEHVDIERRPVNAPVRPVVKGSPDDLLQERTIEVTESAEQAVIGKEARVTEEVVVSKSSDERVENIDDTVRHTRVEVEDNRDVDKEHRRPTDPNDRQPTQRR
jgi:uncharacterized protein (TIGR02271 family)